MKKMKQLESEATRLVTVYILKRVYVEPRIVNGCSSVVGVFSSYEKVCDYFKKNHAGEKKRNDYYTDGTCTWDYVLYEYRIDCENFSDASCGVFHDGFK